jgi:hypothetical protein
MEGSAPPPHEPEVPLGDAAVATEIAQAAARGRGADRAPTLEQLLAAFGEHAPTDAARRRVSAALRVAGMGVKPDLLTAEPGQRLLLLPPGTSTGRSRTRGLLGLLGVAAVLVAAAAGASLLDKNGRNDTADSLPAGTTATSAVTAPAAPVTTPTDTTATTPSTATSASTAAPSSTSSSSSSAAAAAKRRRRQQAAARRRREHDALARRHAADAAAKLVTVRVDATAKPTFLCVDDGKGNDLFDGTLNGKKVFRGKRIRMNVGLMSTLITVNGNPIRLDGSPTGLDITRAGGAKPLPLGQRPCG